MNIEVTPNLGDGLARLEHHLHRLSPKLRAEPPTMFRHGKDPLSRERPCPRSLVHPTNATRTRLVFDDRGNAVAERSVSEAAAMLDAR
jgi:hypothetical protein